MRYLLLIIICLVGFVSCDYFKPTTDNNAIARVNDNYLYADDLKGLISEETKKEDSVLIVNNYINRWATQQLLIDQAEINLSQEKLDAFEKLVMEYREELYTEAYKNVIVSRQLDSTISVGEYVEFYELNRENFRLNDELVKVRYIHLDESYTGLSKTKEKFTRFNEIDKKELSELSIQFIDNNLNDSVWVEKEALLNVLPVLQSNNTQVLKKSNFAQLQDSLGVYLVKIEDVLSLKEIAPLSYIKPTIEQIILNKRKLELIKKLEKDITKDAIRNNKFEIYTPE
jgi:hypothetical protein